MIRKITALLLVLLMAVPFLTGCGEEASVEDMVHYTNGNIYTADDNNPTATDMVVNGNVIVYVGDSKGAKEYEGAEVVDLEGKTVTPGFLNSHSHPGGVVALDATSAFDINPSDSLKQIQDTIAKTRKDNPDAEYLVFLGHNVVSMGLPEGEYPTAAMIDEACDDIPVFMLGFDVHTEWMNTKCIEALGYDKKLPENPPKGMELLTDENVDSATGFTGFVKEGFSLTFELPFLTDKMLEDATENTLAFYQSYGYTGVAEGWASPRTYEVVQNMDEADTLNMYFEAAYKLFEVTDEYKDTFRDMIYRGDKYNMRTLKIVGDGTREAGNMPLLDEKSYELYDQYKAGEIDKKTYEAEEAKLAKKLDKAMFTDEEIIDIVNFALDEDCNVVYHSIGNASMRQALKAFEETDGIKPDLTRTIVHNQISCPEYLEKYEDLNDILFFNSTANWWIDDPGVRKDLGDLISDDYSYKMGSVLNKGVRTTLSDDCPANNIAFLNPMWQIGFACARLEYGEMAAGDISVPLFKEKEDGLTREQALKSYTIWPAEMMTISDDTGSLEFGKNADFTVWDTDFMKADLIDVFNTNALRTYFNGELVYDKDTTELAQYIEDNFTFEDVNTIEAIVNMAEESMHGF